MLDLKELEDSIDAFKTAGIKRYHNPLFKLLKRKLLELGYWKNKRRG